jgi:penicillin-binding protein 1A
VRRVVGMTALVSVAGVAIAALFAVGWVVATADSAPNLKDLSPHAAHPPSAIYAADGSLLGYVHTDTLFTPVPMWRLPLRLKQATVAIEDRRFYQHGPLDYQGIIRAGIRDVFGKGSTLQGASTLTMQLVDNLYLDGTRYAEHHDLKYKITQAKLAEQLWKAHSKDWILNSYLSNVPYGTVGGQTAIGVGAAAQMFFNKPVWQLDLAQMATLAGLPQAPSEYNPFLRPSLAKTRRDQVLQAMVAAHYITQDEASQAEDEPLGVQQSTQYTIKREPFIFDYVVQQLAQKLCPHNPSRCPQINDGGLKVYTTIDPKIEDEATRAVLNHQPGGPNLDAQPAAGLASVDATNGHIVALAQSAPYSQTKFDYPAMAHRQTGSAFKVFALMTLIHDYDGDPDQTFYTSQFLPAGWLPADPTWSVHTAEETYQGTISIAHATTVSDNTVFAQLAADLGWQKLDQTAYAMGITSHLDAYPSEVLGGLKEGVTPLEMADADVTLANGGSHVAPTIIDHVTFPDGSALNLGNPSRKQVFSQAETYKATQVLKTVIQSGTGTAADFGCPAAGKTGTANNMDNAWFVGYTPRLSTAVWVGYPQGNVPMPDGFGGALAAPIWHDFMQQASNGFCGDFPQPDKQWNGSPYFGPHSSTGSAAASYSNSSGSGNGNGNGNGNGSGSGSSGGTAPHSNPYNNPTLYAHPPQPATPSGGGAAAPQTGAGHGGGGGGTGSDHGGGHAGHGGH